MESRVEGEEAGTHAVVQVAGDSAPLALAQGNQPAEKPPVLVVLCAQMGCEVVDPVGESSELGRLLGWHAGAEIALADALQCFAASSDPPEDAEQQQERHGQ